MCASPSALSSRPPFNTVFRPNSTGLLLCSRREAQFQEWRKRNIQRLKQAMKDRPKVYEYRPKPKILHNNTTTIRVKRHPAPVIRREPTPPLLSRKQQLTPIPRPMAAYGSPARRKKRLTKTRPREKSTIKLENLNETSTDDDSGVSMKQQNHERRRVRFSTSGDQTSDSVLPKSDGLSGARSVEKRGSLLPMSMLIMTLIEEVIDHSISEVTAEEKHFASYGKPIF